MRRHQNCPTREHNMKWIDWRPDSGGWYSWDCLKKRSCSCKGSLNEPVMRNVVHLFVFIKRISCPFDLFLSLPLLHFESLYYRFLN
jgi:hypothetical protein